MMRTHKILSVMSLLFFLGTCNVTANTKGVDQNTPLFNKLRQNCTQIKLEHPIRAFRGHLFIPSHYALTAGYRGQGIKFDSSCLEHNLFREFDLEVEKLPQGSITIGKRAACDLCLPDLENANLQKYVRPVSYSKYNDFEFKHYSLSSSIDKSEHSIYVLYDSEIFVSIFDNDKWILESIELYHPLQVELKPLGERQLHAPRNKDK